MRAARNHSIRRSGQNLDQARFVHLPAPLEHSKAHTFPGQRALDEHGLAVHPRDPAAIMRKIDDVGLLHVQRGMDLGLRAAISVELVLRDRGEGPVVGGNRVEVLRSEGNAHVDDADVLGPGPGEGGASAGEQRFRVILRDRWPGSRRGSLTAPPA